MGDCVAAGDVGHPGVAKAKCEWTHHRIDAAVSGVLDGVDVFVPHSVVVQGLAAAIRRLSTAFSSDLDKWVPPLLELLYREARKRPPSRKAAGAGRSKKTSKANGDVE